MDLTPARSNNYANQGCNYLVLIPHHAYLLGSKLWNNLRKSVCYVPIIIVWYLTHVIPVVCILASHMRWEVICGWILYILPHVATIHVCTSADTDRFILGLMLIHKARDICCNHILVFSRDPNCATLPLLVACLCDPIVDVAFTVIDMMHLMTCPTGKFFPFLIVKEYIWLTYFHTVNGFVISNPSFMSTASSSIHRKDTYPAADTDSLGVNLACFSG